jgi:hypothetical protein
LPDTQEAFDDVYWQKDLGLRWAQAHHALMDKLFCASINSQTKVNFAMKEALRSL